MAQSPHQGKSNFQDIDDLYALKPEERLPAKPEGISKDIWSLMMSCWEYDPSKRPTAAEALKKLDGILQKLK